MAIYKNVARTITFQVLTTAGAGYTGSAPTTTVSEDAAAFGSTTNTAASLGNGTWKILLTASEMNADLVTLQATAGGCTPAQREIYTESAYTATRAANLDSLPGVAAGASGGLPLLDSGLGVNVDRWNGTAVSSPNVAGVPKVDITLINGVAASTAATVDSNVTQWSGTSVVSPDTAGYPKVTIKSGTGAGELTLTSGKVNAGFNLGA